MLYLFKLECNISGEIFTCEESFINRPLSLSRSDGKRLIVFIFLVFFIDKLAENVRDILYEIAELHSLEVTLTPVERWPEYNLEIIDHTVKKIINIGIGKCGSGQHIEIINIANI